MARDNATARYKDASNCAAFPAGHVAGNDRAEFFRFIFFPRRSDGHRVPFANGLFEEESSTESRKSSMAREYEFLLAHRRKDIVARARVRLRCAHDCAGLAFCGRPVSSIADSALLVRDASAGKVLEAASKGRISYGIAAIVAAGYGGFGRLSPRTLSACLAAGCQHHRRIRVDSFRGLDFLACE